jgi:prepilin-type N-terminal cleavage/methylation domain-containing protein
MKPGASKKAVRAGTAAPPAVIEAGGMQNRGRPGFSLVEVVMSLVLLSIVLVALVGLTFQTAQRSVLLADSSARQALLLQEVNRMTVVPFTSLQSQVGCDSLATGPHRVHRCVAVATVNATSRRVTIVMRSPRQPNRPDSVSFIRAVPPAANPLNM